MEFTREHWTEQDYQQLVAQLRELADPDYLAFNQKLVPDCSNMLGVRMPELRRLSRQIVKGNAEEYLALAGAGSHEEILLHGMVIGALDCDFETLKGYIVGFVPKISNWAVCDSFCSGLKQFGKEQQAAYERELRSEQRTVGNPIRADLNALPLFKRPLHRPCARCQWADHQ